MACAITASLATLLTPPPNVPSALPGQLRHRQLR
jgi:hypothetical protein